jgi:hypothetical protein
MTKLQMQLVALSSFGADGRRNLASAYAYETTLGGSIDFTR